MNNRIRSLCAGLLALPTLVSLTLGTAPNLFSQTPPSVVPSAAPSAAASPVATAALKDQELSIYYTSNMIGEIDPCG